MLKPLIIPVIHHRDRETTLAEAKLAIECDADGVMLISHAGKDEELLEVAGAAQRASRLFPVGVNLLSMSAIDAAKCAQELGLSWVWADAMGVTSRGLDEMGQQLQDFARVHPQMTLFAGVAFKYQEPEPDPVEAAHQARLAGFVPTTSGAATGQAPDIEKIRSMGRSGVLAIASGMTPENVGSYAPFLTHVFVATGVGRTEYHIDPAKLSRLVKVAREAALEGADIYGLMADMMASSLTGRMMGFSREELIARFKASQPNAMAFRQLVLKSLADAKAAMVSRADGAQFAGPVIDLTALKH